MGYYIRRNFVTSTSKCYLLFVLNVTYYLEGRGILEVRVNWYVGEMGETKNSGKKLRGNHMKDRKLQAVESWEWIKSALD